MVFQKIRSGFSTVWELFVGVWRGPFWWLMPLLLLLLPAAMVFIVLQAAPVVAPFVYTVF